MESTAVQKKGLYYGWVVVAGSFFNHFVTTGFLIYTFSLFAVPVSAALAVSPTEVALAASIYTIVIAVCGPFVGAQLEKGRLRVLLIASAILFGGGFLLMNFATSLPLFYLFYVVIGVGCACSGPVVNNALPSYWFDKKRGLAVGIVNCGGGVAAVVVPLIIVQVIASTGWQSAYTAIGIAAFAILMVLAFVLKTKPSEVGLMPDGLTKEEYEALPMVERPEVTGLDRAAAMKTPTFWLIGLALLCLGFAQLGVMQNAATYFVSMEFDMTIAAAALGFIGGTSTVAKLVFGVVVDKLGPKVAYAVGTGFLLVGIGLLIFSNPASSYGYLVCFAICFGIGIGAWAPSATTLITKTLGLKYFGALWGVLFGIRTVGDVVGIPGASAIAGASTWTIAFVVAFALGAVSIVLMLAANKPAALKKLEAAEAPGNGSVDA